MAKKEEISSKEEYSHACIVQGWSLPKIHSPCAHFMIHFMIHCLIDQCWFIHPCRHVKISRRILQSVHSVVWGWPTRKSHILSDILVYSFWSTVSSKTSLSHSPNKSDYYYLVTPSGTFNTQIKRETPNITTEPGKRFDSPVLHSIL